MMDERIVSYQEEGAGQVTIADNSAFLRKVVAGRRQLAEWQGQELHRAFAGDPRYEGLYNGEEVRQYCIA